MPEWDEIELTGRERELEGELRELGPTMQQAARSRLDPPDPAFLTALRARLAEVEPVVPDPTFQRRLRDRLVGRRFRLPWLLGAAGAVAVTAALAVLLVLHPLGQSKQHPPVAVGIPRPTQQDLIRGYPLPGVAGGGGGPLTPTVSRTEGPSGAAYPTRLHLTTGPLPPTPASVRVYKLAASPFPGSSLPRVAHRLGIAGSPFCFRPITGRQAPCTRQTWRVVAQNLFPSRKPLHSLALSTSGELIYHDLAYDQLTYKGSALAAGRAVALARAWLGELGRPGADAPVLGVAPEGQTGPLNATAPIAVTFGWRRDVRANVPAATIWVAPTGRVVEAHVWPAIVKARPVAARDVSDAWMEVEQGTAPIAIEGTVFVTSAGGSGSATAAHILEDLVIPSRGPAYLEPVYRFGGTVALDHGQGRHHWYTLVPAAAR